MVHKTHSGKKTKVDKGNNGKGSSSIGTGKMDHLGLRKSSSQKMPSGTCKSKVLEKKPPPTPHTLTRSRRSDTSSPLRTPDRDKRHIISSSSGSILSEGELSLISTKKKGETKRSLKQLIMESENVSPSNNHNMSMKMKRMNARSYCSLFKVQRIRDVIPVIDQESERSSIFHRFSNDNKLVEDNVNGDVDCHPEVAKEFGEDHAAQADEVDPDSSSEGFNTRTLHSHGGDGLPRPKHICTSAEGLIAGSTASLLGGCPGTDTEKIPDLIGSTPASEFNSQNGEHSKKRKSDDSQTICKLVSVTAQSTLADHEKCCFTGSCSACLKKKSLDHDSPSVELCTCVAVPKKDVGNLTCYKDKVGVDATVSLESAEIYCSGPPKGAKIGSQVDNHGNICDVCKQDGKSLLCYGEGCRRCYHLSCLGPPLDDVSSGIWHCLWCVKKKVEFGVHSVSKGIESICDAREVEVSGPKGTQRQKQYLVKYQGLAHVHNHWLPEARLLIEVPSILADFNHKNSDERWNLEWSKPQCLLKKRLLSFSKLHYEKEVHDAGKNLDCQYEWLVKWKCLDIENATWELENEDFLCSSHGLSLIKEFESCQEKKSEKFSKLTANDNGLEPTKFLEYWLPVQVSNLQLEQYCDSLLSNMNALCSHSKRSDPVGVLNDVLLNVRKCCDHPYILDGSLIPFNKGLSPPELLDFGVKASGKLLFLDKMLPEMQSRHLRAVIFFQQSIGPVSSLGNILEDFLRVRFGENSYECIEACVPFSKRQAALNRFNKKENGQFVLLLENRMCHASIKLSSVDSVIIYGSDPNPRNDLKLIQKLSFVSQSKPVIVFRLYSCYTVEEQALVIAKQDPNADNFQSLNRNVKNTLMWGASYLFSRLDEYHAREDQASASDISHGQLFLSDVVKELCTIISQNSEMDAMNNSVISKVLQSSGPYNTDLPLFGEQKVKYTCGEEPQVFWKRLLEGRFPRWRHISGPTPRNRKRVQYFESSPRTPEVGNDEAGKKRRKTVNNGVDAISTLPVPEGGQLDASKEEASTARGAHQSLPASTACQNGVHTREHGSSSPSSLPTSTACQNVVDVEPVDRENLPDEQKSLHIYLKSEIAKVFEVLKLSDDVKNMVGIFLDFVLENHRVCRKPTTLLQAMQISLCRLAASLLKQKVDENEILMLTKEHLKFECTELELTNVYVKLRSLKKPFLHHLEKNGLLSKRSKHSESAQVSVLGPSKGMENVETEIIKDMISTKENVVAQQPSPLKEKLVESVMDTMIRQVQCKCDMRMSKLEEKQQEEIERFQRECEDEKMSIERLYKVQLAITRTIHCNTALAKNKVKQLDDDFARDIEQHHRLKDLKLKEIEEKHKVEMNVEKQKAASWAAKAKSCCIDDIGDFQNSVDADNHLPDSRYDTRNLQDSANINSNNNSSYSKEGVGNLQDIAVVRKISDSRDDVANLQDGILAYENPTGPPSVSSPSGCHVDANDPSNILNESEQSMTPNVPTPTTDVVQSNEVLTTTVSEKPTETTTSPAEALVSSLNQPNEMSNIGNNCDDTVPAVPLTFEKHTVDEISVGGHDEDVIRDHPSEGTAHVVPLTSENHTIDEISVGEHSEDVIYAHPSEDCIPVAPLTFKEHTIDEISVGGAHSEVVVGDHPPEVNEASITAGGLVVKNCTSANDADFINNDGNQNDAASKSADGIQNDAGNKSADGIQNDEANKSADGIQNDAANKSADGIQNDAANKSADGIQNDAANKSADANSSSQDQVSQDQSCQLLASNELQSECEAGSPIVGDARAVTQSNCESTLTGNNEPQQPSSGGFSSKSVQLPPSEAACEPSPKLVAVGTVAEPVCNVDPHGRVVSEQNASDDTLNMTLDQGQTDIAASRISSQNAQTMAHEVRITSELPNQATLQPFDMASIPGPNMTLDQGQTDIAASRISSQSAQTMAHEVRITSELPNQAILQPFDMASIPGPNNVRMHHPHLPPPTNSHVRLPINPLSKEMDRIHKELELTVKSHEEWKLLQRSECEREIRDMVAQICKKYEAKIQAGETGFLQRRIELEGNQNKVLMNKILSEAFRSKCLEPKPAALPKTQQAVPSTYLQQQHLQNVSRLHALRSPLGFFSTGQQTPNPIPARPPGFFSAAQPVAEQHAAVPPSRGYNTSPFPRSILSSSGPSAASQSPSAASQSPSASQAIPRSAPLPAVIGRPPLITDMRSLHANIRAAGDIRAPAPHLQPFRPSTSVSAANPSPYSTAPQPGPAPSQLKPTVVNGNSEADKAPLLTKTSSPLPEIGTTFDLLDLSDFVTTGNVTAGSSSPAMSDSVSTDDVKPGPSAAEANAVADVIYLSDDD